MLSSVPQGFPSMLTFMLPFLKAAGPLIMPDITPPALPASSPADIMIMVFAKITGMFMIFVLSEHRPGLASVHCAMLGNGVGIGGAGGAGTRHVSGQTKHIPPPRVDAIIVRPPF
jgi:hypothetical protein